ncbi:cobalamin biosynthesis protein [Pseudomonas sp. Bout1]|uniref:cobalamin biosynthesis protein n=1 Tax=Pseudomonas sp. Bout1 TaxID=3048600 RepID=UPI002AB45F48|nr:cobalamin biosynthesis protein [Pseudomonas sp. Bout1]MDY7533748.1 cobalamin biosynthesis protein [Pseudomonas sp. Bout1]MEB0186857.1 cobalamin biosynthesis protein [Pseudomonas sp. Bout1]
MILAVGLGCQRGCSVDALLDLFNAALAESGVERQRITALASLDRKQDEPGLLALAQVLKLPLRFFSAAQLAPYEGQLSHKSDTVFVHTGCYGIAESAALALAEHLSQRPATLLVTRKKTAMATFALACAG